MNPLKLAYQKAMQTLKAGIPMEDPKFQKKTLQTLDKKIVPLVTGLPASQMVKNAKNLITNPKQELARRQAIEDALTPKERLNQKLMAVMATTMPIKTVGKMPLKQKLASDLKEDIIEHLNPSGGIFVKYNPQARAKGILSKNMTTLDKTMKKLPDDTIKIYRGAPKNQKSINAGDYITTNYNLAKDYAGTGIVLEKKVKLSDILDDLTEPLGEEYIYRPKGK